MDDEHRIQIEGLPRLPLAQQERLKAYQRDMVACVGRILAANTPGAFRQDAGKLRETTMALFGMLNWYFIWKKDAGPEDRARYAELVLDLTLGGLPRLEAAPEKTGANQK